MTDDTKYIKCTICKVKYTETDLGINPRTDERYKQCVKCRAKGKEETIKYKEAREAMKETRKKEAEESNGALLYCNRCYQVKPYDIFVCPKNGKCYGACYPCLDKRYN